MCGFSLAHNCFLAIESDFIISISFLSPQPLPSTCFVIVLCCCVICVVTDCSYLLSSVDMLLLSSVDIPPTFLCFLFLRVSCWLPIYTLIQSHSLHPLFAFCLSLYHFFALVLFFSFTSFTSPLPHLHHLPLPHLHHLPLPHFPSHFTSCSSLPDPCCTHLCPTSLGLYPHFFSLSTNHYSF